jgi:arsenate reductase-like glutaredoxin family protein
MFFGNFQAKLNEKLMQNSALKSLIEERIAAKNQFDELKDKASLTDKTFRNLVEAEEKTIKKLRKDEKKTLRAEKIKQADYIIFTDVIL